MNKRIAIALFVGSLISCAVLFLTSNVNYYYMELDKQIDVINSYGATGRGAPDPPVKIRTLQETTKKVYNKAKHNKRKKREYHPMFGLVSCVGGFGLVWLLGFKLEK